jgi:hypothetical protein
MSAARTKQRSTARVSTAVAADALGTWGIPTALGVVAAIAAAATSLGIVTGSVGLAIAIVALLGLIAERALSGAVATASGGAATAAGVGLLWTALCYAPFHALFFPGAPLHEPIQLHATDASLPVAIPTGGHGLLDVTLEGQLPPNPSGGTAIPVQYAITFQDSASTPRVLTGRFDESLRTQRLGRRGTATVVQAHHAERRLLENPTRGDVTVTAVSLDPAAGSSVTVTAYVHPLPSTIVLVVLAIVVLAAVVAVETRLLPTPDGTLTYATPAVLGAALVLWTSNTVHPTVSSLIGAIIFGGPVGLAVGALLWSIARRTLVHDRR